MKEKDIDWTLSWEVERRLSNWAYWIIAINNNEVGYPSKSTLADFGLPSASIPQSKPAIPINNLLADEMNCWVNLMGVFRPDQRNALLAFYMRQGGHTVKDVANHLGISESTLKMLLRDARLWLMGAIAKEFQK